MSRLTSLLRASLESDATDAVAAGDTSPVVVTDVEEVVNVPDESDAAGEPAVQDGAPLVVDADDAGVIVDTSDSLEDGLADAEMAEIEADDASDAVDTIEEAVTGLESIRQEILLAGKEGGLRRDALTLYNVGIEGYAKRIGCDELKLSVESGTLSMEDLKETIVKGWEALKKFVLALFEKVMEFLKRVFTAAGRLKARAEKLEKAAHSLGSSAKNPAHSTIKLKGLAQKLAVGDKVLEDPAVGIKNLGDMVDETIAWLNGRSADSITFDAPPFLDADSSHHTLFVTKTLPGNVRFFIGRKAGESDAKLKARAIAWLAVGAVGVERLQTTVADDTELKVLSVADILKTTRAVTDLVKKVSKTQAALEASRKETNKEIDAEFKKVLAENTVDANRRDKLKQTTGSKVASWSFKKSAEIRYSLASKICAHAISTAAAYQLLAERSFAEYAAKGASDAKLLTASTEGFKGTIVGAVVGFFGGLGIGAIPGAIIGHLIEEYTAKKRELEELSKSSKADAKAVKKLFLEKEELEKKILAKAEEADAKAAS